jgi:DnaJ-class molecular chaperone
MTTPDLPPLPEPVKNGWMDCEDCDGRGAVGEPIYQGEFQPPECEPCSSCNGSGRWKVPLVTTQQAQTYGDARAAAAVLAERERCAKICDSVNNHDNPMTASDVAAAIRAEPKEQQP